MFTSCLASRKSKDTRMKETTAWTTSATSLSSSVCSTTSKARRFMGPDLVLEIAWEVMHKVGGIHTVLRSKAAHHVQDYGDGFIMIGPCFGGPPIGMIHAPIRNEPFSEALAKMHERGVKTYTGQWMINGQPQVLLFDVSSIAHELRDLRADFESRTLIRVPWLDCEVNDSILFGYMVFWLLELLSKSSIKVVAHFHEWISSIGLVIAKQENLPVANVFTTHATLIGRHLANGRADLLPNMRLFDCDREAANRGFYYRYCIEKLAANLAHSFTTVSRTLAYEAACFLGRMPDHITPNGVAASDLLPVEELTDHALKSRKIINGFVSRHFAGQDIDLDRTFYVFTAGRYEYHNKGVDLFIEALARLNHRLKEENLDVTVVAFIIMPSSTRGFNRETTSRHNQDSSMSSGDSQLDSKAGLPPICTHEVNDDTKDAVLTDMRRCQLFNHDSDRVKVVFHPQFLTSKSTILPLEYSDFITGCDMGVFPSYYEPWGYTPVECIVVGTPTVTSNLSGFADFITSRTADPRSCGVIVLDRKAKSVEESVQELTHELYSLVHRPSLERNAESIAQVREILDWRNLTGHHNEAHRDALKKEIYGR